MTTGTQLPIPTASNLLAINPIDPNINDEAKAVGLAFGDLVETTGMAVADVQNKLDMTGATTAQALANTLVDVIAVEELIYDEFGQVQSAASHTRKLPLINFIDPVFYEWSHVRLQGQFYASEITDSATAHREGYSRQAGANLGGVMVFGASLSGGMNFSASGSSYEVDQGSVSTRDTSLGRLRMNARLQPRKDVTVPKPTQVIQGPHIIVMQGPKHDVPGEGFISGRTMNVSIQYMKKNGDPIVGKILNIETDGLLWDYTGASTTDENGMVEIQLSRTFPDAEADTTQVNFVLSVRKGMVANDTTVQL